MATLKDIALKTGLSVPTVSRILNYKGGVTRHSPETVKLVKSVANQLKYCPNIVARSLATRQTNNICLVLDSLRDSPEEGAFWSRIMSGILQETAALGMNCLVTIENYSNIEGFEIPHGISGHQVDGFIITHPLGMTDLMVLNRFLDFGVPFVVLSMCSDDDRIWSVWCDPNPAYEKAYLRLAQLGHTKVGFCCYPQWLAKENQSRWAPKNPCDLDVDFVPVEVDLSARSHKEEGFRIAEEIASGKIDISAIIMGDIICVYMMERLRELGISVPEDLSIIGLDDTFICQMSTPKLSSLSSPLELMGKTAVSLLQENIKSSDKKSVLKSGAKHIPLSKKFVERGSIGPKK